MSAQGFYALVLSPDAWPATSKVVRADRATADGETLTLWDGDRAVHRVPERLVVAVERHATRKLADDALKALREAHVGGATVHVAELGVVARVTRARTGERAAAAQGTAIPAEGIRVVVDER